MLSPDERAAIRERYEKISGGSWKRDEIVNVIFDSNAVPRVTALATSVVVDGKPVIQQAEVAEFVAHAREDIPTLLEALEARDLTIREMQKRLDKAERS